MNEQLRRIVLAGFIKEDTAAQFLEQITALECVDMAKPISVYIDTYGGNVDSALCMYDAMKACCCPIVTVGVGKVMSSGVLLLAAGDKGNRFITENTRVMIHEVSGGTYGPISEMENTVTETRRMQDVYIRLLAKDSGKTKAKILEDMKSETYMSAAEAVKYGIADKLVPTRKITRKLVKKAPKTTKKNKSTKKKAKK
jgi:ATP-dependent Clp protease protease subunit